MKKNKDNNNSNDNSIEIVIGDTSDLNISEVNDYVNKFRPKKTDKKNLIFPIAKKKSEKKKSIGKAENPNKK